MTQDVSRFRAREHLLNKGEMTPVLTNILQFAGDLDHIEIARFNKSFHRAVQGLQANLCSQLDGTRNVIVHMAQIEDDLPFEGEFNEAWKGLEKLIEELRGYFTRGAGNPFMLGYAKVYLLEQRIERYWTKIVDLKSSIDKEAHVPIREARKLSLSAHLQGIESQVFKANLMYDEHQNVIHANVADPFPELEKAMLDCICEQNVAKRFRTMIAERGLDPATQQSACLKGLYETQKVEASLFSGFREQFFRVARSGSFSVQNILAAERVASAAEVQRGANLLTFWREVRRQLVNVGIAPFDQPRTPQEIEAWMKDAQNAPILENVKYLHFDGFVNNRFSDSICGIPPEIQFLKKVESLTFWRCKLTTLPKEIENLTDLRFLELNDNELTEIPEVIGGLKNLEHLSLERNQIRDIPDFLVHNPSLRILKMEGNPVPQAVLAEKLAAKENEQNPFRFLGQAYQGPVGALIEQNPPHIDENWGRDSEPELEQIPFRLWFEENFRLSLPQLDWYGFEYLLYALLGIPLFIYNFLLMEVVERIVSIFRDELDLESEVDVEPQVVVRDPIGEELRQRVQALMPDGDNL